MDRISEPDRPPGWERFQQPLRTIDPIFDAFAAAHSVRVSRNARDWPERSLRWADSPSCLIQLYLAGAEALTWHLWLCCSEDRGSDRYWREERLIDGQPLPAFADRLPALLQEGYDRLNRWRSAPEQLRLVTRPVARS